MASIYMSPDPYYNAFEEELNLKKFCPSQHKTAGLCFFEKDDHIILATMSPHTPGSRIPRWRTNLRGAWLISINNTPIKSITDTQAMLASLAASNTKTCTLLFVFAHPEAGFHRDISHDGLPVMSTC